MRIWPYRKERKLVTLGGSLNSRTKGNRYKNRLDFIITLVIVNLLSIISYKFLSYTD